jgi:hypothetical protein
MLIFLLDAGHGHLLTRKPLFRLDLPPPNSYGSGPFKFLATISPCAARAPTAGKDSP